MTQQDVKEFMVNGRQEILQRIKKVRQVTLRRFLLCVLDANLEGSEYVISRRAKHDYKLALDILFQIDKFQTEALRLNLGEE